ncbi:HAD family hydrolase [Vibrio cidicii]|nr:HAD family hydrolase [Vibrio cidicii]
MNLALFDFDGTLTNEDMFSLFLNHSASGTRKWMGRMVIAPFYLLYKANLLPSHLMRPIASWIAFKGRREASLQVIGKQFAREVISRYLRPEAMAKLAWHQQRGDRIILVSASLDLYLRHWCDAQGIDLLCSEMAVRQGRYTGKYQQGDCSRKQKVQRVKQHCRLSDYSKIYAYGDTEEDRLMLNLADEAYMNWQRVRTANR